MALLPAGGLWSRSSFVGVGQRADRRVPERRGAAGRGPNAPAGAAVAPRELRPRRRHRRRRSPAAADLDGDYRVGWSCRRCARSSQPSGTAARSRAGGARAAESDFSISALFRLAGAVGPGLVVLFAFLVEGSMDTWSGNYLRSGVGAARGGRGAGVHGLLGRGVPRPDVRGTRAVRPRAAADGAGRPASGPRWRDHRRRSRTARSWSVGLPLVGVHAVGGGAGRVRAGGGQRRGSVDGDRGRHDGGLHRVHWSPPLLGWVADTFSLRATMSVIVIATVGGSSGRGSRRRATGGWG